MKLLILGISALAALMLTPVAAQARDGHRPPTPRDIQRNVRDFHRDHFDGRHDDRGRYYRGRDGRFFYSRGYGYYDYPGPFFGVYGSPVYYYRDPSETVYYGNPVYYSRSASTDVQRALKRRGYYHGSVDGDIGPASRAAIRAYQVDRGFPVTSTIDSRLLDSLGLD